MYHNTIMRVGIIGLQGYGGTYFATLAKLPYVEIAAVCDAKQEVLERVANQHGIGLRFTDYKEMLAYKEIDVVFIATPHFLHYQMTMDALKAGKHVFCEKPLAMNRQEAEEMVKTAAQMGLKLGCHYNRRQTALVKLLKDIVSRNVLGEIYAANIKWMARYTDFMFSPDSAWRTVKSKAGGGILIGRGSHMIDAAFYILGNNNVQSISANISSLLTGLEVDDYCLLVLRMKEGPLITIECSYENNIPQYEERIEYQLFGTKAGAYCKEEGTETRCQIGYCSFPKKDWVDISEQYVPEDYAEAYPENIIIDFMETLHNGTEPVISGLDAQYVTTVIDMAYESARLGREIVLEDNYVSERV